MALKALLVLFSLLGCSFCWAPCAEITHSECRIDDNSIFEELDVPDKAGCHLVCLGVGERCKFFIFDEDPYAQGNCRLCKESFAHYISHCNEIAGPKTSTHGCDWTHPPDNTCQIFRSGNCHFENLPDETIHSESLEHCQEFCKATTEC